MQCSDSDSRMEEKRESQILKESLETWMQHRLTPRKSWEPYDEYMVAMKRAHDAMNTANTVTPRARHRQKVAADKERKESRQNADIRNRVHISTIASMVPDEIIQNNVDYSIRTYETALMFIDVSGFTELCECYTKTGRGGPSKLTQVLNSYIGAMIQEILSHNGDVVKFAGDSFLSMWKTTATMTMQDIVHTAIDCGLIVQKNYGTYATDLGITLKVKVAITAGVSHFAIIGDKNTASYVIVGQAVWDVKAAQYMTTAGDVIASAGIWAYVNEAEYCTQPCGDGRHTKVMGVGITWKRVEKLAFVPSFKYSHANSIGEDLGTPAQKNGTDLHYSFKDAEAMFKEYSLRPSVVTALRSSWWLSLRRFILTPVLRAVDNEEPIDNLTEVRHVVIVFLNLIAKTVTEDVLIDVVARSYKHVCSVTSQAGGLVNKVSLFDKDTMFLVVFGLRGLKHEDEAQKALLCAFQLKQTLKDPNILNVSIGVTSGRTYCGAVGHVLRREYTVIGSSVNKAARLMTSYKDKVTCDKETFVRSKLRLDLFRLMEHKQLKGIINPGPIYEFNKCGWPERMMYVRHPILGRNEELRIYRRVLQNAIEHQIEHFTRYHYMRYGIIITGPRMVGKKRLVDEFISITPNEIKSIKLTLTPTDMAPYQFIRILLQRLFESTNSKNKVRNVREAFANRIRHSLGMLEVSPLQIHAINTIFDLRFPLPENFSYSGDFLTDYTVMELIQEIFNLTSPYLVLVAVLEGQNIDDDSWRVLIHVMDVKSIFIIIAITDQKRLSAVAKSCMANHVFVKMPLRGIDRWYHAALACQLLDVQAIPADLEKVIESASGGLPGWIQNFVISLIQRGELTVVSVPRSEALQARAVMPLAAMLQRTDDEASRDVDIVSFAEISFDPRQETKGTVENEIIQMAVLAENYDFDDMKVDMTMDVIILKTYDSLTPYEKIILKCASVIGNTFSRRMLLHLLQSDSQRKVAMAVSRLFEIRVLQCEGGDFSQNTSVVLVRPAPVPLSAVKPPYCACLGTSVPHNCHDLPSYGFCGYMKFRHSLFRTTTYELLTENQKQEMHARSLMYLERYTRRCINCGGGCFVKLFGVRSNDGLKHESKELKKVRQQIKALSAETRIISDTLSDTGVTSIDNDADQTKLEHEDEEKKPKDVEKNQKRRRSFSFLDLDKCECLPILLSVYKEGIDHIRVAGNCEKVFETYMEYVDLSLLTMNVPQAVQLLIEVDKELEKTCDHSNACKLDWINDYRVARVATMRGACMMESGELSQAKKYILQALNLLGCKFPTSRNCVKLCNMQASLEQSFSMYCTNRFTRSRSYSWIGEYYDHVARALNRLYSLFTITKQVEDAALAAKWSLKFARKSNNSFRLLCACYSNMICVYRQKQNFSKCLKLEKLAMDVCHRKLGRLDITEVYTVCALYTNILLFYLELGKKHESLDIGLSIIPIMSVQKDISLSQVLVMWLLKILLADLRINEMVIVMREFFYMTDNCDLSYEAWYYYYALLILLDTGLCVETYNACEKFYIKQGDAITRSKTPEAAWNFFVCMWLVTLRIGSWERAILWYEKIQQISTSGFQFTEYYIVLLLRLIEGFLIVLVDVIDKRNLKKVTELEKKVLEAFGRTKKMCQQMPMFKPRYLLLYAYYHMVNGKKSQAYKYLSQAQDLAKLYNHKILTVWIKHTKNHWDRSLSPKLVNYWAENVDVLDYKTFKKESKLVPYTLPLPKDVEY